MKIYSNNNKKVKNMRVHEEHKKKGPEFINIALIIVSTSRFEEKEKSEKSTDKTIPLVEQILNPNPSISLRYTEIIADSSKQIKYVLDKLKDDPTINTIIFSGGTGLSPKDITYETVYPLLEKRITGFGELFRYLSYKEIGSSAMLSRALAGKLKDKAIFLIPGSPNAVELALKKLILPELKHVLYLINKKE
ncbi:MAG: MogA/MoaB family molybdenum cofactor biosynthesis protein [Promethearchaeota archaeon]